MRWEHTLEIDAPPERVWQITLDVDGLPSLSPSTMTSVRRLDGDLRVGGRVRIKQPGQFARTWTVRELDAPRRFVWGTTMGPLVMVAAHVIEPVGSGCRNTLSIEMSGPGAALIGRLIGRAVGSTLATENAGYKRVAEGAGQQTL